VYKLYGTFWGLKQPTGNAPGSASDSNSLPNPVR
jgi:hypothetical protein